MKLISSSVQQDKKPTSRNKTMNNPYFRSSANASSLKKTKKRKSSFVGAYFSSSSAEDPSSSYSNKSSLDDDDSDEEGQSERQDDDQSIHSQNSMRSSFSNAGRLLKMTAAMPVVLAAKTTKTVARKSYQAGAAMVQGTVSAGNAVGSTVATGGKALGRGTTAVVKGSSKAIMGGTTAVVKGGSKAIVGGTNAIMGGTSAVVMGSSRALVHGTSALVGGTTSVTKKTVKGLQQRASYIRPGGAGRSSYRSQKPPLHNNQWDVAMATLDEILLPGSVANRALSSAQRKNLQKIKKMLLQQGGGGMLSSPVARKGDRQTVACLPMDLLQLEKQNQQQQRMFRRNSNGSSNGNASYDRLMLHQETASVTSDASYLLQEYGGIRNPSALLLASHSEEFDDDDFLDTTSTSDISMSESGGGGYLMSLLANTSASTAEESGKDPGEPAKTSPLNADWGEIDVDGEPDKLNTTAATSSPEDTAKRAVSNHHKKMKKKKPPSRAPPPTVSITLNTADMKEKSLAYETFLPSEFQQLGGIEQQRTVYNALHWDGLSSWDFDVFDLDRFTNGNALLFLGWAILGAPYSQYAMANACDIATEDDTFIGYPFMDKLSIPPQKLVQYLRVIQQDYHAENPYHNAVHAADVLQTVHTMIQMALRTATTPNVGVEEGGNRDAKAGFFVRSCPNHLKLFSILLAAVVHDVDHPGKNNAFHTKLRSELAVMYNDRSVLENWHIAHAFARMVGLDLLNRSNFHKHDPNKGSGADCDCNLLCNASPEDFASIRNMMIEAVLQTDMTKHFAIVTEMKSMFMQIEEEEKDSRVIHHDDDRTWSLLMFMLHQADISGQAKADPLFLNWTDRCLQEFFTQGDEEAALGMWPISPYCDRKTTNQAVAQVGFVEFVVQPSYQVLGEYIPEIQSYVLPIIQEVLEFWYDASGKQQDQQETQEELEKEKQVELSEGTSDCNEQEEEGDHGVTQSCKSVAVSVVSV